MISTLLTQALRAGLPLLLLAAGVGGFVILGSRKEPPPRVSQAEQTPLVETVAARPHRGGLAIAVDGVVVPFREVTVAAEVAGRVAYKAPECRAGRYVSKGDLLVRIDPSNFKLEVERLTRELEQAEASLQELAVDVKNTEQLVRLAGEDVGLQRQNLARARSLLAQRAASDAENIEARRNELAARNNLQTLENQLRAAKAKRERLGHAKSLAAAKLEQAKLDLRRTEVRAPLDGVILSTAVEENGYVQPGAALLTIEDTSAVEVRCSLRMEELAWLWQQYPRPSAAVVKPEQDYELPPAPVQVVYRLNGVEYVWDGVLARYEGLGVDEKTRTVPCRVLVAEPRQVTVRGPAGPEDVAGPRALVRGMFVSVRVRAEPKTPLLALPERAVRPGDVVWKLKDGRLDVVPVEVVRIVDRQVLLRPEAGRLAADDKVITSPLAEAREGMAVREEAAR